MSELVWWQWLLLVIGCFLGSIIWLHFAASIIFSAFWTTLLPHAHKISATYIAAYECAVKAKNSYRSTVM